MNIKKERNDHLKKVYLLPGHFFWGDQHHEISTSLGSCIAICMWHPVKRFGGMCHYRFPGKRKDRHETLNFHYGDDAVFHFLELIKKHNTKPSDYIVKIFGGASMFEKNPASTVPPVGVSNSQFAIMRLVDYGFSIRIKEIGGTTSRKIYFNLSNGDVLVQKLNKVFNRSAQ